MLRLLGFCTAQLTVIPPRATAMPGQMLRDVQVPIPGLLWGPAPSSAHVQRMETVVRL